MLLLQEETWSLMTVVFRDLSNSFLTKPKHSSNEVHSREICSGHDATGLDQSLRIFLSQPHKDIDQDIGQIDSKIHCQSQYGQKKASTINMVTFVSQYS